MNDDKFRVVVECISHEVAHNLVHYVPCYTRVMLEYHYDTATVTIKNLCSTDWHLLKWHIDYRCPGTRIVEYCLSKSGEESGNACQTKPALDKALDFLDDVKKTLKEKNKAYGDSAANPLRIFSKSDKDEAIKVRIDDKLSRIAKGDGSGNEDAIKDLVGYLALLAGMRK